MGEPRTEMGRRLLAAIEEDLEEQASGEGGAAAQRFAERIVAIEDEAAAGSLDAAWAEAEAALPKRPGGGVFDMSGGIGLRLYRLNERMYAAEWGETYAQADTPAAALRALAERLVQDRKP